MKQEFSIVTSMTPALHHDVILLKQDHLFIELLPRPGQITSAWTRLRNGALLIAAVIEPVAVLITKWSLPLLSCTPPSGSNTRGQEECTLGAKVLKVVKSNDSVC